MNTAETFVESSGPSYRNARLLWIKRKDIQNREGDVYITRWHLLPVFGRALMLHCMRRPDGDRCHHDHPWWFLTLVLKGGYVEEVARPDGTVRRQFNRPGTVWFRPALHTHRVAELPTGKCWTLVVRGPYTRKWGFRNHGGEWRAWDRFVDWAGSVLWCDERQ